MNHESAYRTARVAIMVMVATVAPVATPTLIWVTLAADLPLAVIILELVIMAVLSSWSFHGAVWACDAVVDGADGHHSLTGGGQHEAN